MIRSRLLSRLVTPALILKSDSFPVQKSLGDAYMKKAWYDEALECYMKASDLKPDAAGINRLLGDALLIKGQDVQALNYYRKAITA